MKHALILAAALSTATPIAAEEDSGMSLMEKGAQLFMEGIMRELEPALEGLEDVGPAMRDFAQQMGPALGEMFAQIKDWSRYHPPEILPNGDIIIRRKTDEEMDGASEPQDQAVDI